MSQVSVIIPTRNRSAMLVNAIDSVMRAGSNLEVIVVDDASTDDTNAVCRKIDGIVYLRLEHNAGLARARNAGIKKSTGEYIAFLDDDDLRSTNSLNKQAELLDRDAGLGFVYGQVYIGEPATCLPTGIVRPSRCLTGDIFGELVKGNFIYVPSVMVRRRCFEQIGLFALDLPGTEDWDAWLRLSAISRVDAVQEPVGVYRDFTRQSGQMSSNRPRMLKSSVRTQCRALRSPRGLTLDCATRRGLRSEFLNRIWDELIREGHLSVSDGDYSGAAMNYLTAAELYPSRAMRSALRYLTRIVHQVA